MDDLLHRVVWTFIQAFVGTVTAAAIVGVDLTLLHAALVAGIADVLVVMKEYTRYQLARHEDIAALIRAENEAASLAALFEDRDDRDDRDHNDHNDHDPSTK